jgi:hypothetical protein
MTSCLANPMEPCWRFILDEYSDDEETPRWWNRRANRAARRDDFPDDSSSCASSAATPGHDKYSITSTVISAPTSPEPVRRRKSIFGNKKDPAADEENIENGPSFWANVEQAKKERKDRRLRRQQSKITSQRSLDGDIPDRTNRVQRSLRSLMSSSSLDEPNVKRARSLSRGRPSESTPQHRHQTSSGKTPPSSPPPSSLVAKMVQRVRSKSRERRMETFEPVVENRTPKPTGLYFGRHRATIGKIKLDESGQLRRKAFFQRK